MKPLNITPSFLSSVLLTVAFMSASMLANADDHKNKSGHKKHYRTEYRERDRNHDHYYDSDDRGKGHKKHYKEYKHDRDYKAYKYDRRDCYDHPKYGRVYHRFEHKPYVLRHSRGNYYYSDNRFYTYRDGVGYCVTEAPRHIYFDELPFSCSRVHVRGQEYYRNGDIYFRLSNRGYVIVPAPLEVNLSVRF